MGLIGDAPESPPLTGRFTARSGAFIGSVNLLARTGDRVAAFAQIIVMAAAFGASSQADIYFLAGIVPLTIGYVVGDPLGRGFLSLLVRAPGRRRATAVASAGLVITVVGLTALTAAYVLAVIGIVRAFAPAGSSNLEPWLAFAPTAPALGLSAYLSAVLLWLERYAWASVGFPLASAASVAFLAVAVIATDSVAWAALAVSSGYALAALVQAIVVTVILGPTWLVCLDRAALKAALDIRGKLLSPMAGGLLGGQVVVLLERMFATSLGPGAIATLSYARGIAGTPQFISHALGAGVYPGLVRAESAGSTAYMRASFFPGLRMNVLVGGAFALYFALFGEALTATLLHRGAFAAESVGRAGTALAAFALSTLATSVLVYGMDVLYGIGRFRGILIRSVGVFAVYLMLAPLLLAGFGASGLAFAFSLAQTAGAILAVVLVTRPLGISARALVLDGLAPVVPALAIVAGALGLYRLVLAAADVPVELRGELRVGGSGVVLLLATAIAVTTLPEWPRLRQILGRLGSRGAARAG